MLRPNDLDALQSSVLQDCAAFSPELILSAGIVLLLFLRLFTALDRLHLGWIALGVTAVAFGTTCAQWLGCCGTVIISPDQFATTYNRTSLDLFGGMLIYDNFTVFLRLFLLSFTGLIIWLTLVTGIPDKEDSGDFYTLILGATVGMMVMSSTNHLIMMFIGVE